MGSAAIVDSVDGEAKAEGTAEDAVGENTEET